MIRQTITRQAVGFLFILGFCAIAPSCNNKPNDKELQENITRQLQENAGYKGVNTSVKDGIVTLDGSCEGDDCAAQAAKQAAGVAGVDSVQNNIQADNKTDLTLRTSVQSIISKYEGVQADVAAGVVVLRGSINRNQIQPLMNELTNLQPKKIDNQLAIKQE
jgi:osmotically-inducible protein OsmY